MKTGADYPQLVQHLKELGVQSYAHVVANGANVFYGMDDHSLVIEHLGHQQNAIEVSENASPEALRRSISIHQQGRTDYPTFCVEAGEAGVARWVSDLQAMTVTYLDQSGNALLVESIPSR